MRKLAMIFLFAIALGIGYAVPAHAYPPDPCMWDF